MLQRSYIRRTNRARCSVYAYVIMYRMTWIDERMDDFAKNVDQRFDAVDKRFDSIDQRLDRLDDRFAALQRTLVLFCGTIIAALIAVTATQL